MYTGMIKAVGLCVLGICLCSFWGCGKKKEKDTTEMTGGKMAIQKTASGLEIEILQEGKGAGVQNGQSVVAHYTGWLLDKDGQPGKIFDSSVGKRPFGPIKVGAGRVIKGWDEGLIGMKVGEKRKLYIPANLAYGKNGVPGTIPPNAALIFEVELVEINT